MPEATAARSHLHLNPFALLEASPQDGAQRLHERATHRRADLSHADRISALTSLLDPKARLAVELRWLPGVTPLGARLLLSAMLHGTDCIRDIDLMPPLARANALVALMQLHPNRLTVAAFARLLVELDECCVAIGRAPVLKDINQDRQLAGIQPVPHDYPLEAAIERRQRELAEDVHRVLDGLPTHDIIHLHTELARCASAGGTSPATVFANTLVRRYEEAAAAFIAKETESCERIGAEILRRAPRVDDDLANHLDALIAMTRNLAGVGRPMLLLARGANRSWAPAVTATANIHRLAARLQGFAGRAEIAEELFAFTRELFGAAAFDLARREQAAAAAATATSASAGSAWSGDDLAERRRSMPAA